MTTLIRVVAVVVVLAGSGFTRIVADSTVTLLAQQQPKQQEEFTPIEQLPPEEQLPAAPLLVGAYAFVLLMLFGYMLMVSRRLTTIQQEVERLDTDLKRTGRS
jgi:CcmD family protein